MCAGHIVVLRTGSYAKTQRRKLNESPIAHSVCLRRETLHRWRVLCSDRRMQRVVNENSLYCCGSGISVANSGSWHLVSRSCIQAEKIQEVLWLLLMFTSRPYKSGNQPSSHMPAHTCSRLFLPVRRVRHKRPGQNKHRQIHTEALLRKRDQRRRRPHRSCLFTSVNPEVSLCGNGYFVCTFCRKEPRCGTAVCAEVFIPPSCLYVGISPTSRNVWCTKKDPHTKTGTERGPPKRA